MTRSPRRIARLRAVLEHRQPDLTVVMENIHDPHNVSAVFRTCDAVGVAEVNLLYTVEPFPRIGKKSSSSANKWLGKRKFTTVEECFTTLHSEGLRIYATRIGPGTLPLYDVDLTGKVAMVLGNEHRGVSDEAASAADGLVSIPMMGVIESLNVSVAAAVCLYESLRQRLAAGSYRTSSYPPDELERLLNDWLER
jgi:tRNA (guanosine-2'-O-)-methyltransferase